MSTRSPLRFAGAAAVVLLAVTAALGTGQARPVQIQCRFNGDCDGIAVCAANYCRAQCATDRDCMPEATCVVRPTQEFTVCLPRQRPPVVWQRLAAPERFATIAGGPGLYGVTRAVAGGGGRFARVVTPGRTMYWGNSSWVDVGPSMPEIAVHRPNEVYGLDDGGRLQRLDRASKVWAAVAGSPALRSIVEGFDDVRTPAQGGPAQAVGSTRGFTTLYAIGQDARLWRFKSLPDQFLTVEKETAMVVSGAPKGQDGPSSLARATFLDPTGNVKIYVNDASVQDVRWMPPLPAGTRLLSYSGQGSTSGYGLTEDGKVLRYQFGAWEPVDGPTFRKLAVVQPDGVPNQAILCGLDEQGAVHTSIVAVPSGANYVRPGYQ